MVDDSKTRRASIPILFTRGTHYEVGYEVVSEAIDRGSF